MLAAGRGGDHVVGLLLAHGARTDLEDDYGRTALERAVSGTCNRRATSYQYSLWDDRLGADNRAIFLLVQATADPGTIAAALREAAYHGQADIVDLLLAGGAEVDAADSHGRTALMLAAQLVHQGEVQETVGCLISAGADIDAVDSRGQTALMLVVEKIGMSGGPTSRENMELLIRCGADTGVVCHRGDTALSLALLWQIDEVAELLRAAPSAELGAAPASRASSTLLAASYEALWHLHSAAERGDVAACRWLLDRGVPVDILDGRENNGYTALMLAAEGGWDQAVCLLLAHGARADLKNHCGRTALELAVNPCPSLLYAADSGAYNRAVFLLLQATSDPEAIAAALRTAAWQIHFDVDLLLAAGPWRGADHTAA